MRSRKALLLGAAIAVIAGGASKADWNPGDPYKMHYPQLPDLTTSGLDVNATFKGTTPFVKVLADDFKCSSTGPINDIHIWGSWLNDQVYNGAQFKLSIHSDIAAGPNLGYSYPGNELWSAIFQPTQYVARPYASGVPEHFYDPNTNQILGNDTQIWQYNFTNIANPFVQQQGVIYWLDVQVLVPDTSPYAFGWKTTNPQVTQHFLDDAVYGDTQVFAGPAIPQFPGTGGLLPWKDLHYPLGVPFETSSMDLAFVITPEPAGLVGLASLAVLLRRRK